MCGAGLAALGGLGGGGQRSAPSRLQQHGARPTPPRGQGRCSLPPPPHPACSRVPWLHPPRCSTQLKRKKRSRALVVCCEGSEPEPEQQGLEPRRGETHRWGNLGFKREGGNMLLLLLACDLWQISHSAAPCTVAGGCTKMVRVRAGAGHGFELQSQAGW